MFLEGECYLKTRREKLIFVFIAAGFALGLFVYSVLAVLNVQAKLHGAFNFTVPPDAFFLDIKGRVEGARDEIQPFIHSFNLFNKNNVEWSLGGLNFKENSNGLIEDIVFIFEVENLNSPGNGKTGRVRINYQQGDVDAGIELKADDNLSRLIELAPIPDYDDPTYDLNKATFTITLSLINNFATESINNANFNFTLIFDFID